jgi:hypothetical protein
MPKMPDTNDVATIVEARPSIRIADIGFPPALLYVPIAGERKAELSCAQHNLS